MNRTIPVLLLLLLCRVSHAQNWPFINERPVFHPGVDPTELSYFNTAELRSRKIDSAVVIGHPASWLEFGPHFSRCNCSYTDTMSIYRFNSAGRIRSYTIRNNFDTSSSTFEYDSAGGIGKRTFTRTWHGRTSVHVMTSSPNDTGTSKVDTLNAVTPDGRTITQIVFWKFDDGYDTAYIKTFRYDTRNRLLETGSRVNRRRRVEVDDDTGELTYFYRYQYDDSDRLTYYRHEESSRYERISYPPHSKITETRDVETDRLLDRSEVRIDPQEEMVVITHDKSQTVCARLEKGSTLFCLLSLYATDRIPYITYREIIYYSGGKVLNSILSKYYL